MESCTLYEVSSEVEIETVYSDEEPDFRYLIPVRKIESGELRKTQNNEVIPLDQ